MIYLLHGENQYELQTYVNELISAFKKSAPNAAVESLDGEEIGAEEVQNLTAQSLFAEDRLVIIKEFSANKNSVQLVTEVKERIPDSTSVIFWERKLRKNTEIFKLLSKLGETKEFKILAPADLPKWVQEIASELGTKIDPATARLLVERVENDQSLIANEVRKLAAYDDEISKDMVENLVEESPRGNVFNMLDELARGNTTRAIERYRELLAANMDAYYVMSMVAWQLTNLATVAAHEGKTAQQIAKEAGLSPYVVQKNMAAAANLSKSELRSVIDLAAEADLTLKKSAANPDQVVEQLIVRLSSALAR